MMPGAAARGRPRRRAARGGLLGMALWVACAAGACGRSAERRGGGPGAAGGAGFEVSVLGREPTPRGCRVILRVRARRAIRSATVQLAGQGAPVAVGPLLSGEARFVALRARRPCARVAPKVVSRSVAGAPPAGWSAEFGLLDWKPFDLPARAPRGISTGSFAGQAPRPPAGTSPRCLVAFALRVRTPGPVGPVLVAVDGQGRAVAIRDRVGCGGRVGRPAARLYCQVTLPLPCARVRRVLVSRGRGAPDRPVIQTRLRIAECSPEGEGQARVLASDATPVPAWAGAPGTVAYLLGLRGNVTGYAPRVARIDAQQVRLRSPLRAPCVEASLVLLQRARPVR